MTGTLRVLGQDVRPLERVSTVGELLGMPKSTAYRLSEASAWPMTGPKGNRWVLVIPLCRSLGIPVDVGRAVTEEKSDVRA